MTVRGHKHAEAFCLMLYRDTAGNEEWIWNSRDVVTPFCVLSRQGLPSDHVEWHRDQYLPSYIPPPGSRYFVSMTRERASEVAHAIVESCWNDHDKVSRASFRKHFKTRISAVDHYTASCYGKGEEPDLAVVSDHIRPSGAEARPAP